MAIEGELARAGIITLTSEIIFTRDVSITEDLVVEGTLTVNENATFDGDINVGGTITGTIGSAIYWMMFHSVSVGAGNVYYAVIPTDGDGTVTRVRWVVTTLIGAGNAVLTITTATGAIPTTVTIPTGSAVATVGFQDIAAHANCAVAEGEALSCTVSTPSASGAVRVFVEITI